MRKLLLSLSLVGLGLTGAAAPAAAQASIVCEGYCLLAGSACYATVGLVIGKDKCDAFYEGCVDGCQAVAEELQKE